MDKDLLRRYIEGCVTPEEVERVVDWLDADEQHVTEFLALHKVFDISVLNQLPAKEGKEALQRISLHHIVKEILKIAAIVLLILGGQSIWEKQENEESAPLYQTLYVPAGQRAELILPDSTRVWLNACSRLMYPVTFMKENRLVELEGEAYFEVQRNEKAPFIVKTPKTAVRVLGTEFNVSDYPNRPGFELALLKGSVELLPSKRSNPYRMKAGEQILLKDGKYLSSNIEDTDYFKWKEGLLCFRDQPISEIIDKLSLYFDVKIYVENQKLLSENYTGKFLAKDGIEQVLKVLQLEHKFVYVKNNELKEITIK